MCTILKKIISIWEKNLINHLSNKKKLVGELLFPIIICIIYYIYKKYENQLVIHYVLHFLLMIYIGLITSSSMRELITLFINERQQMHRQYQMINGLSFKLHTFSNLFYMMVYTSVFLFPFYCVLNFWNFQLVYILNFAAFVISSCWLVLFLSSLFTDHKIATEVIGLVLSVGAFLPLFYQPNEHNFVHYLAQVLPNSSFTLSIMSDLPPYDRALISLASLAPTKLYALLFTFIEFPQPALSFFMCVWGRIRSGLTRPSPPELHEQIEMQSYEVLEYYDTQENNVQRDVVIEVTNVQKSYGHVQALNQISLKVYKKEIFGLLGRNGAGKTTLVDIITNVTKPTGGKIKLAGENGEKVKIGICYQHQILYENLTFMQHLKFYSRIKSIQADEQWEGVVQKLGVQGEVHKKVKQLSGGNKRKLSVALALLGSPGVLIFDEPTSGLDPHARRNIWGILKHLKQVGSTIILTTHHLDEADYLSDRICVIEKGVIIEESTAEGIKNKYGNGYYLSIYATHLPTFNPQLVHKIITHEEPTAERMEEEGNYVRYFLQQKTKEEHLITMIKHLEEVNDIYISLKPNSLEQSFLNIIHTNEPPSPFSHARLRPRAEKTMVGQVWGVMLKNGYNVRGKFFWIYLSTMIMLTFITVFNNYLVPKIMGEKDEAGEIPEQKEASGIFVLQGYMMLMSAFISIPVYEKEKKIIQLLRTRGLTKLAYWVGHYLFDIIVLALNTIIMRIVFMPNTLKLIPIWLIFLTATCSILYAYCASKLFNKLKTANSWFTVFNTLICFIVLPVTVMWELAVTGFQGWFVSILAVLRYFLPVYDMGYYVLINMEGVKELYQMSSAGVHQHHYVIGWTLVWYVGLLVLVEGRIVERVRAWRGQIQGVDEWIRFDNVVKNYGSIEALKGVSFDVQDERVALLGHNGAGKSTTFGLLSCQLSPTSGSVFVEKQARPGYKDIMVDAGICYQDNTLWQNIDSDSIIQIFGYICGVADIQEEKEWLYESLQFNFSHRKFEHLSGGNKRKLCMMVCLMGTPSIKYLDECSTGLDPVSRLSMVSAIKYGPNGCTVLTTHSMGEAEDVCSRVIIMDKGSIVENQPIYSLKHKHANYYEVQIESSTSISQLLSHLCLSGMREKEGKWEAHVGKQSITLSQLLTQLQELKKNRVILGYRVRQPSLQDVYISITGDQEA